jgi:GT2 family glycosyltransferase
VPDHVTLSISIVVYKKYDDVLLAIDSIERFTDKSLSKKLYIVDNSGYADGNHYKSAFLESLSKYDDVEYVDTKKNLGFGKGHNYIIPCLNSDYHAIVNPDIVLYSDVFTPLVSFLSENQDVGMTAPVLTDEYNNVLRVYRRDITVYDLLCRYVRIKPLKKRLDFHTMEDVDKTKNFDCEFVQGSFLVVRTDLFKNVRGFDDRYFMYAEDADLCRTIRKQSRIVVHPVVRVVHKWEKASHTNFKLTRIHAVSLVKYFNKWGWKWS